MRLLSFLAIGVLGIGHSAAYLHTRDLPVPQNISILPLGDSITEGYASTDGNGYRLELKKLLQAAGQASHYIGTNRNGKNNDDNRNEGWGGYRINGILDRMQHDNIIKQSPNLVLLHAGTNDLEGDKPGEAYLDTPARLDHMLNYIFCNADTIVIVAQVIRNYHHPNASDWYNEQILGIVRERYLMGHKIQVVDMSPVTADEMDDPLHPNDKGYKHMARMWYTAIQDVPKTWWHESGKASTSCDGKPFMRVIGSTLAMLSPMYADSLSDYF